MRRRRSLLLSAVGLLAVAALTGCEVPGIEPGAAEELRSEVAVVTQAADAGEYERALRDLDDLTVRLQTATRQGDVSLGRQERISEAIKAVRLDLETEIALQK
ncbi:hypothetical protein ABIB35_000412 [Arthrobacter sp. UYP6]|uniref:hypothetical protein n=1 Tax=Arthrobacter sp. UYP6 TaxID=1756378 RepID=UPI0033972D9D